MASKKSTDDTKRRSSTARDLTDKDAKEQEVSNDGKSKSSTSTRGRRRNSKSVTEVIVIDDKAEIKDEPEGLSNLEVEMFSDVDPTRDSHGNLLEESDHSTPSKRKSRYTPEMNKGTKSRKSKDTLTESYEDFVSGIGHKTSKVEVFPESNAPEISSSDKKRSKGRPSIPPSKPNDPPISPKKKRRSKDCAPKIEIKTEVAVTDTIKGTEDRVSCETLKDIPNYQYPINTPQVLKKGKAGIESARKEEKAKQDEDHSTPNKVFKDTEATKHGSSSKKSVSRRNRKEKIRDSISIEVKDEPDLLLKSSEEILSEEPMVDRQSKSKKSGTKMLDDVKVKIETTGLPFLETFETVEASNKRSSGVKRKSQKISCSSEDATVETATTPISKRKKKSSEDSSSVKTKVKEGDKTMKIKITTKVSSESTTKKKSKKISSESKSNKTTTKKSPKKKEPSKVEKFPNFSERIDDPILLEEDPDSSFSPELEFQSPSLMKEIWNEHDHPDAQLAFNELSKVEPVMPDEREQDIIDKKAKKKEEKKHQKVVDVQFFNPEDTTIVKVKKKKIYKKKHGEKILVRIIKNHINKNGDTVKTETVVIDKSDEKVSKNDTDPPKVEPDEEEMNKQQVPDDEIELHIKLEDEKKPIIDNNASSKLAPTSNKKALVKSSIKSGPKTLSTKVKPKIIRPANKNVTVKGKVVGKTTKGMKKTGIAAYDSADEEVDVISSKTTPKAPMQMVPVTQARQV